MATEVKLKTRSRWLPVSRRSLDKDLARLVRTQSNINANNSVKMRSLERKLSKAMKLIKELQDK